MNALALAKNNPIVPATAQTLSTRTLDHGRHDPAEKLGADSRRPAAPPP
jgi:hypothetical protein